jgi:predicted dehydrogenase
MKPEKKRYAVAGVSHRAYGLFMDSMLKDYKDYTEFVAMLDSDKSRMDSYNSSRGCSIPSYSPDQFDKMIKDTSPDTVIVACQDCMHHHYIIQALKYDLDVIVEKPLTTSVEKCAQIAEAAKNSSGKVSVTFNYRYAPINTRIRELIAAGKVGKVISLDLNWFIDTYHGSSYFQRWNREREKSGGLSVHKSCHHFDLVQWWIDQKPLELFSYGARNFFGSDGVHNPLNKEQIGDGRTCLTCDARGKCRYYMRWYRDELRTGTSKQDLDEFVSAARKYHNYSNRQCIYDPQIEIEDTYGAVIKYDGGAIMSYSVNFSTPYEGFRIAINGTEGRIEFDEIHAPMRLPFSQNVIDETITYIPLFGGRERIEVINDGGNHGGGDPLMLDELFIGPDTTCPVTRQASVWDGIDVVLTGIGVAKSVQEHRVVTMQELRSRVEQDTKEYYRMLERI